MFSTFSNRHAVGLHIKFNSIFCTRIYSSGTAVYYQLYFSFLSISNCRFLSWGSSIPFWWIFFSNASNMIDMSSQIIIDCCYLCFSELLEIKGNPRVRFARLFVSACLPIMRTQTPENTARRKRGLQWTLCFKTLRFLEWTPGNGGFRKRARKMCHINLAPACVT